MTVLQAIVLGIVEGITEFLPVSSTGHILLTQRILGIPESEAANAYAICVQAGAICAVLGLYPGRYAQLVRGVTGDRAGLALLFNLGAAFLPAAVVGLLFDDLIESYLFGLWPIVFAWLVGGVGIVAFERSRPSPSVEFDALSWRSAALIGLAQCVAMWPGTSRSLVTIVAGVLLGLSLPAAVEFSFLLGTVTLGAATAFKALQHGDVMLATYGPLSVIVGFVSSFVSGFVAVKWMVAWIGKNGLEIFAGWRIGLAVVVAGCLIAGIL